MIVSELIKCLKKCDPKLRVLLSTDQGLHDAKKRVLVRGYIGRERVVALETKSKVLKSKRA